jgi:alpha-ketoglutaric semialdehyde dehydrogenase
MKQLFIGGRWMDGATTAPNINPSDLTDVIDTYAWADSSAVALAVSEARAAQDKMSNLGIQQRADALDSIGTEILARRAKLGDLLAREEGKTLPESTAEVVRAGQIFKYFAGQALRLSGSIINSVRPEIEVSTLKEPLGIIGVVTPWNFPIAIPAWKVAPALASGNCVVLKPAEQSPGCAWALAEIISRSGLPAGAFNLVMGGAEAGAALTSHPDIDGVTFTGSSAVGTSVLASATANRARVQLEMGGKNPLVVLKDADLAIAWDCAIQGAFYSTGQRCTASSRLVVERAIHDEFVDGLIQRMKGLKVGNARAAGTQIGPVADDRQLAKNLRYLTLGQDGGATLACGGDLLDLETKGHYLSPALFVDATPKMAISQEEIFGPIACVISADDYEHALAIANDTPHALSTGICTTSLKFANHFRRHAEAGLVMVNLATAGIDYHVPFGGHKASSYGPREQGEQAIEFFTRGKTAYVAL